MNIETIIKKASSYGLLEGYIYLALTDRLVFEKYDHNKKYDVDENKLLECRIFNKKGEYKVVRTALNTPFKERYIEDSGNEYIEESHYLDIDTTKCQKLDDGTYNVTSTGGGRYHLPFEKINDTKIIIHSYVDYYPTTGQAYIYDYRLVSLEV